MFLGKLMSALLNGIHDRSSVVQKQYAFALGHLVRVNNLPFLDSVCTEGYFIHCVLLCPPTCHQTAKDSSVEKLLLKLNTWYLEKEGRKYSDIPFKCFPCLCLSFQLIF